MDFVSITDAVGNMVSYTTRAGQTKTSVFDNRNREVSYTWSDATPGVTRTYDAAGRLLSSGNGVSTSTYAYDNANELVSETQTNASLGTPWVVSYSYDADGNKAGVTYPSGVAVTYGRTNRNQINTIAAGGTNVATYSYDSNGNVLSKNLADGTLASYTYDAVNRLTTLNHTLSGTSFARFDYGYDSMNRRTYEQRNLAAGDVYGYDAIDQVTGVNYDATSPTSGAAGADRTVGYTYDATGNRTAVTDNINGNTSYSANNLNQYTNVGGASYAYDGNGNLLSGNGLYLYDAQNRLNYAQVGSNIVQVAYDSKNRVVERIVNGTAYYLVYDGWDLIEERNSSGTVLATYIHGVKQDELLSKTNTSGTVYYHHNALGSVIDLTNSSGAVIEKYKYDAFGKPSFFDGSGNPLTATAYGNRFLFTGREYLAKVNLYDYRNRVYSADLGRFLQTDPLRFSAGDVNIYRYCGNNPLNLVDYLGTADTWPGYFGGYAAGAYTGAYGAAAGSAFWEGFAAGEAVDPAGGGLVGGALAALGAWAVGESTNTVTAHVIDNVVNPPPPAPPDNPFPPSPNPPPPPNNFPVNDPYHPIPPSPTPTPPPPPSQVTNCDMNGGPDWTGGDNGNGASGYA
jgi:RHS repeat-associated protein